MEVVGGDRNKCTVFLYELLGTSLLVYTVLVSGGNMIAVPFTIMTLIVICGPITGAHFNPAITMGVYIMNKNWKKDRSFLFLIWFAEFIGGFFGVFLSWLVRAPSRIEGQEYNEVPVQWQVPLCPAGVAADGTIQSCDLDQQRDRSAFFFQLFGTMVFVFLICCVKGQKSGPTKDGALGALLVSLCLLSVIASSANQGGAAYNPAVAVAQLTVSLRESADDADGALHDAQKHYMWIFILAPFLGGAIAGGAHILHEANCAKFQYVAEQIEQQKQQEQQMQQMIAERKANYQETVAAGEQERANSNSNEPESPRGATQTTSPFVLNKSGGVASSDQADFRNTLLEEEEKENAPLLGDRHASANFGEENERKRSTATH